MKARKGLQASLNLIRSLYDKLINPKFILAQDRNRHSSSPLGSTGSSTGSGGWEPPPPTATNGSSRGIQLETPSAAAASGGDTDDRDELKKVDEMSDSYGQLSPARGGPHPDTDDTNTNDEIDAEVMKAAAN